MVFISTEMNINDLIEQYRITKEPYYRTVADEVELFEAACGCLVPPDNRLTHWPPAGVLMDISATPSVQTLAGVMGKRTIQHERPR